MLDMDRSGDISPEDLVNFFNKLGEYKREITGDSRMINFDKTKADRIVYNLDLKRHRAITPDQFLNIVMASYEK